MKTRGRPSNRNALGVTVREQQIIDQLLIGVPPPRIGPVIGMSYATVRSHLKRAFKTLGVTSLVELIAKVSGRLP